MPRPIRFLTSPPLHGLDPENGSAHYDGTVVFAQLEVGDMCFYHYRGVPLVGSERLRKLPLTAHYFAHNAGRAPLLLKLPDAATPAGLYFLVDGQCYSGTCTQCGAGARTHKYDDDATHCANGVGLYIPKGYYDGWTVTGEPPLITVSPSVDYDDKEFGVKHYHGFIQNGVIGDG